ncbi:hypothetical protein AC792_04315 [Arthrobacter sp. RIT-PI-e]|uniref:L,D-transpeptidase n=1 Tax=Arthrobacter sp. RIT-PI-e TaxID=1681197 RepID=UPI000675D377|nr:Ig-like domain-containing protein [Arthrobacter sp. RIT-PI-e]KNC19635.1 hypothetical protein AC792_04315 [Arthrobacter sp. RIT-PI-e]
MSRKQDAGVGRGLRHGWRIAAAGAAVVMVLGGGMAVASVLSEDDGAPTASPTSSPSGVPSAVPPSSTAQAAPDGTGVPAEPSIAASDGELAVRVSPEGDTSGVNPVTRPAVTVTGGTLEDITLIPDTGGAPVAGTVSEDGAGWVATERLAFDTGYTFSYTVRNADGQSRSGTSGFTTVEPANEADAAMFPRDGSTVGTGQPLEFTFSEPVTERDAVEAAITVTSTSAQPGAFYWISDTKVRYRPEEFWAPNSTITVDTDLFGVDFGNGMIGNGDSTLTVRTHDTRLAVVDNLTKTMEVYIDGKLTRTFPITLGTEEWPSTEGYMVVMEKYASTRFTAESIGLEPGDAAYYPPTVVQHASRLSKGGAFVHEALPAAQVALGSINVSHGCVGMSPEGAAYFYDTFGPGDVVQILNTDYGPMYVEDGFGDWNVPWEEWTSQP